MQILHKVSAYCLIYAHPQLLKCRFNSGTDPPSPGYQTKTSLLPDENRLPPHDSRSSSWLFSLIVLTALMLIRSLVRNPSFLSPATTPSLSYSWRIIMCVFLRSTRPFA